MGEAFHGCQVGVAAFGAVAATFGLGVHLGAIFELLIRGPIVRAFRRSAWYARERSGHEERQACAQEESSKRKIFLRVSSNVKRVTNTYQAA